MENWENRGRECAAAVLQDAAILSPFLMNPHPYRTPDVYLASFLLNQGAVLTDRVRVGHRRVLFQFVADEKLHHLVRVYWKRFPVQLVPAELFAALQRLKARGRWRRPKVAARAAASART